MSADDVLPDKVRRLEARCAQLEDRLEVADRRRPFLSATLDPATREVMLWVLLGATMTALVIVVRHSEVSP